MPKILGLICNWDWLFGKNYYCQLSTIIYLVHYSLILLALFALPLILIITIITSLCFDILEPKLEELAKSILDLIIKKENLIFKWYRTW